MRLVRAITGAIAIAIVVYFVAIRSSNEPGQVGPTATSERGAWSPSFTATEAGRYLAVRLPDEVRRAHQGTLRRVSCFKQTGQVYRCVGTYTPSRASIRKQYPTDDVSDKDIDTLYRRAKGGESAGITVTLEQSDGSFIYEFGS